MKKSSSAISSKSFRVACAAALIVLLTACAQTPPQQGLSDLSALPGEKALLAGIHAYQEAQYDKAEKSLNEALAAGFTVKKDAALANKYLAFIYCTSSRVDACKQAFRAARAADPSFALSRSEAGHPLWGPVFKEVNTQ